MLCKILLVPIVEAYYFGEKEYAYIYSLNCFSSVMSFVIVSNYESESPTHSMSDSLRPYGLHSP